MNKRILNEELKKVSPQTAHDKNFFGPVYHGTTPESYERINKEGFKIFTNPGEHRHGYISGSYGGYNAPPPIHHLGFGIYFTTSKAIFKKFNLGSGKNMKEYYLDVPRLEIINFGTEKTMMKWWISQGYDIELAKKDRYKATMILTENLKSKYDAVWFKGKSLYSLLDGDQIVVFDVNNIYQSDPSLTGLKELGSNVITVQDVKNYDGSVSVSKGTKGVIVKKYEVTPNMTWAKNSEFVYHVRFKPGGLNFNILDYHIEPLKSKK